MKLDKSKLYQMPFLMGPQYDKHNLPALQYPRLETVALQYVTKRDVADALVPDCYVVDERPIVTVMFTYNKGLDFLAGGGYTLAAFQISARFDGTRDHITGDYIPIMYENDTLPILGGREYLGVPKLYADIPPIKIMSDGNLRCELSVWGHLLFGLEVSALKRQNPLVRGFASRQISSRPWLAYKYIPSLDGPPDADYPTTTRNEIHVKRLWMGKQAKLYFGSASVQDIHHHARIIEALKTLEILEITRVLHFQATAELLFSESYRLK